MEPPEPVEPCLGCENASRMDEENEAAEVGGMDTASALAQQHWNDSPLFVSEQDRYGMYPWLPEVAEFARHDGDRMLEIGCGTGCDLLQFARHGAQATGVDIATEHLRLARERLQGKADVVQADGRTLPFPDDTFDYVYSHGVIHHSDEPEKIAAEIFRVLKPGGRFNIHVYARWSWFPLWLMVRHGTRWRLWIENSRAPVHIELYTARRLKQLFGDAITLERRQSFARNGLLEPLVGWYWIAKGEKRDRGRG
jgi:SAM-dependent methyltransferase